MEICRNDAGRGYINFSPEDHENLKSYFESLHMIKAEDDVIGIRIKDLTVNFSLMIKTENYIHNMPPETEKYDVRNGDIYVEKKGKKENEKE